MSPRRRAERNAKRKSGSLVLIVIFVIISIFHSIRECVVNDKKTVKTEQEAANSAQESIPATEETTASIPSEGAAGREKQTLQAAEDSLEVPKGNADSPSQILVRQGYTVSYNKQTRIPNWVAWHLTADRLTGTAKRKNADFSEDTSVPTPRADDYDYYNSGYDRGHLCPAADNKMSAAAMEQSFLFTNICPQAPNLNRGDWNELEIACRKWAKTYGGIYIVSGPILYNGKHKTIGKHKITVPEAFFKVVLRYGNDPKAIGFIYKNEDGNNPQSQYVNTVDQVERITGIDFFPLLPDDIEAQVEAHADISEW